MTRLGKLLRRDERGASVVELALVAPVFAALLLGMVDLSGAYSARLELEQAAQQTIENVMQQPEMLTDYEDLLKARRMAGMLDQRHHLGSRS